MQQSNISLAAVQWSSLPDIDDVTALTAADHECLDAIREVLVRHNAIGRFGVTLVHRHFDVAPDEVLVEYTDIKNRTLRCQVEKRTEDMREQADRVETMWTFVGEGATRICNRQCRRVDGGHKDKHYLES